MKKKKRNFSAMMVFSITYTNLLAQPLPPAPVDGDPIVGIMGGMGVFVVAAMFLAAKNKGFK